jgi:diadenylate cyclase
MALGFDTLQLWVQQVSPSLPILWKLVVQFTILSAIIYFIYNKFIRFSHADRLVKGQFVVLMLLIFCWAAAKALQFPLLEIVFGTSIQLLIIGLIVIFQPELRRILLFFGQNDWFSIPASGFSSSMGGGSTRMTHVIHAKQEASRAVKDVLDSVRFLSKKKIGALIVLESDDIESNTTHYLEQGTPLYAQLSAELLLTIFHPNTPLHDGAVVIANDQTISAAGVLLPLTEDPNLSWRYGTRHRAAIGLTEVSTAHCIVVSEETGNISYVSAGKLVKLTQADDLAPFLDQFYQAQPAQTEQSYGVNSLMLKLPNWMQTNFRKR